MKKIIWSLITVLVIGFVIPTITMANEEEPSSQAYIAE